MDFSESGQPASIDSTKIYSQMVLEGGPGASPRQMSAQFCLLEWGLHPCVLVLGESAGSRRGFYACTDGRHNLLPAPETGHVTRCGGREEIVLVALTLP